VAFVGRNDQATLRSGRGLVGGFLELNQAEQLDSVDDEDRLTLRNYISYDEMLISALLGTRNQDGESRRR
jgi:hypothetical protein